MTNSLGRVDVFGEKKIFFKNFLSKKLKFITYLTSGRTGISEACRSRLSKYFSTRDNERKATASTVVLVKQVI